MNANRPSARLDNIGITASTLCAIHCAAVPVLITFLPFAGFRFLANPWLEWGMIVLALVIGLWSIGSSYAKTHNRMLPVVMLLAGFMLIGAGHAFASGMREAVVVPLGGFTIAAAHFVNARFSAHCKAAH